MKNPIKSTFALGIAFIACLVGCHDAGTPATVQQQAEMARGHQPTPQELARAMSRMKGPSADQVSAMAKPPTNGSVGP